MLRVYLDQNHWVSLTKAQAGRSDGEKFSGVLVLLKEAVERGWVSLPLSVQHVIEVQNRNDWKSRQDLASTMIELSRWHTIGYQRQLVGAEIDASLKHLIGRPLVPRQAQVFGMGLNHAFGRNVIKYEPPAEVPGELRDPIRRWGRDLMQIAALVGAPPNFEVPGYDPSAHRQVSKAFAEQQEQLRTIRRPHGYHRGDLGLRATSVDVFTEYEPAFTEALDLASLHWGHVYALERDGMERLLELTPIVFTHRELRRLRHEASPKHWEPGDLIDLTALASAIVYCDVVVTERVWTAIAQRTDLQERYHTTVLRSLDDLVPHLIGAAHV
ncbi:MAG TPA: hypothetical protein VGF95_11715 [Solirubrobacteraceae bacterium]|jgi:hypothetical protein